MKHIHHIIPKYEGGSDEPCNLVELTPLQHAMWHYAEWSRKQNREDYIAWKGLSKTVGQEEIQKEILSLAGKKGGKKTSSTRTPEEHRKKAEHMRSFLTLERLKAGGKNGLPDKHSRAGKKSAEKSKKGVKLFAPDDSIYTADSLKEAAEIIGCTTGAICNVLKKRRAQLSGWRAEYL